jgi:hypothetical protein
MPATIPQCDEPIPPATVNERTRLVDQLVATTCPVVLIKARLGTESYDMRPGPIDRA